MTKCCYYWKNSKKNFENKYHSSRNSKNKYDSWNKTFVNRKVSWQMSKKKCKVKNEAFVFLRMSDTIEGSGGFSAQSNTFSNQTVKLVKEEADFGFPFSLQCGFFLLNCFGIAVSILVLQVFVSVHLNTLALLTTCLRIPEHIP